MHNFKSIAVLITLITMCDQGFSQTWLPVGEGLRCDDLPFQLIYDIAIDSTNGNIYANGSLGYSDDCAELRTAAMWNGEHWSAMGPPLETLNAFAVGQYNGNVYGSGSWFGYDGQTQLYLGKWNGATWDSISGAPHDVWLIEQHGDDLYIGGTFDTCDTFFTKLLTRYRNGQWEQLIPHFDDVAYGLAMEIYHDTIFIGGQFGADDFGEGVNDLAKVHDMQLTAVGNGLTGNSIVESFAVYRDTLFIGGAFGAGNFPGFESTFLLTYANGNLKPYPIQPDGRVVAMKVYDDALYLGGWFYHVGDSVSCAVARLRDLHVDVLSPDSLYRMNNIIQGITGSIRDMEIYNDTLYLAGGFYAIGTDSALNNIAKLNKSLRRTECLPETELIKIYPNPSENLSIDFTLFRPQVASVQLYDLAGQLVESFETLIENKRTRLTYQMDSAATGIYILRVECTDGLSSVTRWMKY